MNILILGECSGKIRDAFIKVGHKAISCDSKASDSPGPHHQGDFYEILPTRVWDLVIAHPTCTKLCVSGNSTYAEGKPKHIERLRAAVWTQQLWEDMRIFSKMAALENPVGVLPRLTSMGKPTQYIQPYDYGHCESKKTGLWLYNLPKLTPTNPVEPEYILYKGKRYSPTHCMKLGVKGKTIYGNQTPSGQNKLGPSADRAKIRSETYQGWADAMANQWGSLL